MKIDIDPHILKKIVANRKKIYDNSKRIIALFTKNMELEGENNGLLEFIENVCDKEE